MFVALKRTLSVALVITLTLLLSLPALAAGSSEAMDYAAFGDSVAAGVRGGVGTPGSESGSDFGYTDLIAALLVNNGHGGAFSEEFCVSGMTAVKLAKLTDVLNDPTSAQWKTVSNAEMATLDIGANDLLGPLYDYVSSITNVYDADISKVTALLNQMAKSIASGNVGSEIQSYIEIILQNILTANPNISIYVMGYYNPLPAASALCGVDLSPSMKSLNGYIQAAISNVLSKNKGASITYVDTMTAMSATAGNLVMTDIHPTEAGYKVIADQFWNEINKNFVQNNPTAKPMSSNVVINKKAVAFEAYNIGGSNYFKLRDIAMALSGTTKQFNMDWDGVNHIVGIYSTTAYAPVGGELSLPGKGSEISALPSTAIFYLDSAAIQITAYNIGGSNYVKLRDVASLLDFFVGWDGTSNTIAIDTSRSYQAP